MERELVGQNKEKLILPLQGLRATAFIIIFLSHSGYDFFSPLGGWGVSVFLILSGFLMTVRYYNADCFDKASFFGNLHFAIKRVGRLYPLHLLMSIPVIIPAVYLSSSIKKCIIKIVLNLALIHSFVPYSEYYYSLNSVSWYLSVVFFIYLCYPWIQQACRKINSEKTAIIGVAFLYFIQIVVCFMSYKVDMPDDIEFSLWMSYICPPVRLIDFCIGCMFGVAYIKNEHRNCKNLKSFIVALSVVYICIVYTIIVLYRVGTEQGKDWWNYSVVYTLPNAVLIYCLSLELVGGSLIAKLLSFKGLIWLGNMSAYGFLVHQMVIRYVNVLIPYFYFRGANREFVVKIIVPLAITIIICVGWHIIVKYFRRVMSRLTIKRNRESS